MRTPFRPATPNADPLGGALRDYLDRNHRDARARVLCSVAPDDWLRAHHLFRPETALPELEVVALEHTHGRVLDIGAGAGAHSVPLHQRGLAVTALDSSAGACYVLRARHLPEVIEQNLWAPLPAGRTWDTMLLLMNGLGLPGTLDGLGRYLRQLRPHLAPGGQLLATSCDIAYLFEQPDGSLRLPLLGAYYGEVQYQMTYREQIGEPFPWLYLAAPLLPQYAAEAGFATEILTADEDGQYLARLTVVPA